MSIRDRDLFERLKRQRALLDANPTDEDRALDFCLTAWSLADWDFYFKNPDLIGKRKIRRRLIGRPPIELVCMRCARISDLWPT